MTQTGWSLRRRGSFLLAVVTGLVILADWLFYEQPVGWTASLFGLALLLAVTLRDGRYLRSWPGRLVALATLGLVASLVIEPGVMAIAMGVLGLVTLAIIDRIGWTSGVVDWAVRWATFFGRSLTQGLRDLLLSGRWARTHGRDGHSVTRLRGWVIPVVLSAVFVALFALANPVVQRWIEQCWTGLSQRVANLDDWIAPGRIALWLGTAAGCWALLRVRTRRHSTATPSSDPGLDKRAAALDRLTTTALVVRCLALFNIVFAVQTTLDLLYLYGGASLPVGMSYAQYAHRGAYPLVATALLAGAFVLLTFRPGGASQRSAWARRLVNLWIGQNILLMGSAVWRLHLYVEVYSLTRWRVAAAVWMLLVAVGFAWLVWRIVAGRDNAWLLQRVGLTAAAVLFAVCFIDLDGRIASYNVAHCREMGGQGQSIDADYLEALGIAALPAMNRLLAEGNFQSDGPGGLSRRQHRLEAQLKKDTRNWRGWTLQRDRLLASVR